MLNSSLLGSAKGTKGGKKRHHAILRHQPRFLAGERADSIGCTATYLEFACALHITSRSHQTRGTQPELIPWS